MGNIHFTEIFDFILGWLTLDFSEDDWATRIAQEDKALQQLPEEPSKELKKEAAGASPEGPPKELPKKPPEEPSAKKPPKEAQPKRPKFELHELVP